MIRLLLAGAAAVAALTGAAPAAPRVVVTVVPVRPYQPGDLLRFDSAPPPGTDGTLATGCQRVPASGYLTTNSVASTTAEYANHWEWSNGSAGQAFAWWIKKTDGTTVISGSSAGAGGSANPAANDYVWRVENRGGTPQAWNVCYDVL